MDFGQFKIAAKAIVDDLTKEHKATQSILVRTNVELLKVVKELYMQNYGLKNHWCGIWIKCPECSSSYASGGNWNDGTRCPYCAAKKFLDQMEG